MTQNGAPNACFEIGNPGGEVSSFIKGGIQEIITDLFFSTVYGSKVYRRGLLCEQNNSVLYCQRIILK